jgi:hypothetical protein
MPALCGMQYDQLESTHNGKPHWESNSFHLTGHINPSHDDFGAGIDAQ